MRKEKKASSLVISCFWNTTKLLDSRDSATTLSAAIAVALAVHHLVRLVNLFPAPFLLRCRRFVALALFECDLAAEVAEVIESLGAQLTPLDRGEHRAARLGLMDAVTEPASLRELGDVFEGFGDRRLVHPRL